MWNSLVKVELYSIDSPVFAWISYLTFFISVSMSVVASSFLSEYSAMVDASVSSNGDPSSWNPLNQWIEKLSTYFNYFGCREYNNSGGDRLKFSRVMLDWYTEGKKWKRIKEIHHNHSSHTLETRFYKKCSL